MVRGGDLGAAHAERLAKIALREARQPASKAVVRGINTSAQSIPDTTETALEFSGTSFQSDLFRQTSKTTLTIRRPFIGRVVVSATFGLAAAGVRLLGVYLVRKKVTTQIGRAGPQAGDATYLQTVTASVPLYDFLANDQVYATVVQTSGGALSVQANGYSPVATVEEITGRVL